MRIPGSTPQAISSAVIGVDVGGTKIAAALVDADGKLSGRVRSPTDLSSTEATLDSIAAAARAALDLSGFSSDQVSGVGLGIPGLVDPQRGIGLASVNLGWHDVPVRDSLQSRLGLPCIIENDVRAAALGEAFFGAGSGLEILVFLTIGTGIAASVVLEGHIYRGAHSLAGEIGHAVIQPGGPLCKCGGHGCFESLASGPSIAGRLRSKFESRSGSSQQHLPAEAVRNLTAEEVFRLVAQGDELATETIREVADDVAFVLQFLALTYDPQVIVLAGGVSQAGQLFLDPVRKSLERYAVDNWVFNRVYTQELVQLSQLGEDIGILGAAALINAHGFQ